ncbi:hypothetical protein IFR05_014339 [Cadophora sp. M221]|nr:hypothetical protein IFR05_014339 [Cadophora sp. M221]
MNLQLLLALAAVFLLEVGVATAQVSQCPSANSCTSSLTCDQAKVGDILRFTCGTNGALNFAPANNSQNGKFDIFQQISQDACYGVTFGGKQSFFTAKGNSQCENFIPRSSGVPSAVTYGSVGSGTSPPSGSPPPGSPPPGSPPVSPPPGSPPPSGGNNGGGNDGNNGGNNGENGQGGCSRQQIISGQGTCTNGETCCATQTGGCPVSISPQPNAVAQANQIFRTHKSQKGPLHSVAAREDRLVSVRLYLAPLSQQMDPALEEIVMSVAVAMMDVARLPL